VKGRSLFLGAAALLAGCARVSVNTDVAADGSFTRTVHYAVATGGSAAPDPTSLFAIPRPGNGVTVTPSQGKDEDSVVVTLKSPSGSAPLQDITLLSDDKKPLVQSVVRVLKREDGALEYDEDINWVGPVPQEQTFDANEVRKVVKGVLPERDQVTATIDRVSHRVFLTLAHLLLGPPDPIAFSMLGDPDMVNHKARMLLMEPLKSALKSEAPDLTDDEALNGAKALTQTLEQMSLMDKAKEVAQPPDPSSDNKKQSNAIELSPLTFAVSYPGKLVESNGLADPYDNQVYWSLYPMVLPLDEIHLKLVAQP